MKYLKNLKFKSKWMTLLLIVVMVFGGLFWQQKENHALDAPATPQSNYQNQLPSAANPSMSSAFDVLQGSNGAALSGNTGSFAGSDKAAMFSKSTYNLLDESFSLAMDMRINEAPYGLGFAFFSDATKPQSAADLGGALGRMSMYGALYSYEGKALPNSVAVELDKVRGLDEDSLAASGLSHAAITLPNQVMPKGADRLTGRTGLEHFGEQGFTDYPRGSGWVWDTPFTRRLNIWWETPAVTQNGNYRLRYEFYNATDNSWLKGDFWKKAAGSKEFTPEQVKSIVFGSATNAQSVRLGVFCGGKVQLSLPSLKPYTLKYYKATADGQPTNDLIEEFKDKSREGTLVEGVYDFSKDMIVPSKTAVPGYTFKSIPDATYVSMNGTNAPYYEPWIRFIKPTATTELKFYYAPNTNTPYKTNYIFEQSDGSYKTAYTYNQTGTSDTEATALYIGPYLETRNDLTALERERIVAGYQFTPSVTINGTVYNSANSARIKGDGSTVINKYYQRKTDVPFKVEYRKLGDNSSFADAPTYQGTGKFLDTINLNSVTAGSTTVNLLDKTIAGYEPVNTNPTTITLNGAVEADNKVVLYYQPKSDISYKVNYFFRKYDDTYNDVDGYYSDGKVYNAKTYERVPDKVMTYTGETDSTVTAPNLTVENYPTVLAPNNLAVDPEAFRLDPDKDVGSGKITADGKLELDVYLSAKRYPFYIDYYKQKPGTTGENPADYQLHNRAMPGERGFGTIREIHNPPAIAGYTLKEGYAHNKLQGRILKTLKPVVVGDMQSENYLDGFAGLVLKAYYTANTDIEYTIRYLKDTGVGLIPLAKKQGQTASTITETAPTIPGYSVDAATKNVTLHPTEPNEIVFKYTAKTDTPYKVNYYKASELIKTVTLAGTTAQEVTAVKVADLTPENSGLTSTEITDLQTQLTDYSFNATASNIKATLVGDGSSELNVYYSKTSGLPYKMQYYLNSGENPSAYELDTDISYEGKGNAGVSLAFNKKIIAGYTFDETNANNVLSAVLKADETDAKVLKGYYKANENTKYIERILKESPTGTIEEDGKKYELVKNSFKTGTTGKKINYTASSAETLTGYTFLKAVPTETYIAGDGNTVVSLYYTANEATYQLKHYREYRQDLYPPTEAVPVEIVLDYRTGNMADSPLVQKRFDNPFAVNGTGKVGDVVKADGLNLISKPSHPNFNDVGRYYVGFTPDLVKTKANMVLNDQTNVLDIYYKGPTERPYTIEYYTKDAKGLTKQGEGTQYEDAISGATISIKPHLKTFEGYASETYKAELDYRDLQFAAPYDTGFTPEKMYNPTTLAPRYPYLPLEFTGHVVVKVTYEAKEVPYKVEHYLPTGLDENGTAQFGAVSVTENLKAKTAESVTGVAKTGEHDARFTGFVVDATKSTQAAEIAADGSTVLKLYYVPDQENPAKYLVKHFLEKYNDEGVAFYGETAEKIEEKTGIALSKGSSTMSFVGYTADASKNAANDSITINGDGTTVYKYYYKANANTEYKVEHYKQTDTGYTKSDEESLTGVTAKKPSSTPKEYTGYVLDGNKTTGNEEIKADGTTIVKLYYDKAEVHFKVFYKVKRPNNSEIEIAPAYIGKGIFEKEIDLTTLKQFIKSNDGSFIEDGVLRDKITNYERLTQDITKVTLTSADVDMTNINNVVTLYYKPININTTALDAAISKAEGFNVPSTTDVEVEKELLKALEDAKAVKADSLALQDDIDNATQKLKDAILAKEDYDKLVEAAKVTQLKAELKISIDSVPALNISPTTEDVIEKAVLDKLAKAETVYANDKATSAEVQQAKSELDAAIAAKKAQDGQNLADAKALLDTAIKAAEAKLLHKEIYTPETVAALEAELALAKDTYNSNTASLADVKAKTASLTDKTKALVNNVDKAALQAQIDKANAIKPKLVASNPVDKAVLDALQKAEEVNANPLATTAQVTQATNRLKEALADKALADAAEELLNGQLKQLKEAIAHANSIDKSNKTPDSVNALTAAVNAGQAIVDNHGEGKTTEEINQAIKAVLNATKDLKNKADKSLLRESVSLAEELGTLDENDTEDALVKAKLEAAQNILNNDSALQADVDNAKRELDDAMLKKAKQDALDVAAKAVADRKAELQEVINQAKAAIDADTQTPKSIENLNKQIAHAETLLGSSTVTADELSREAILVNAKKEALTPIADTTALEQAIADAQDIANNNPDSAVARAVEAANVVLADKNATQDRVDEAKLALDNAVKAWQIDARKQEKGEALEQLKAILLVAKELKDNSDKFTPSTVDVLNTAIVAGEGVVSDATINIDQVDLDTINDAVQGLIDATNGMKARAKVGELNKAITEADALTFDGQASDEQKAADEAFKQALIDAKTVAENPEATQNEVDQAKTALQTAIDDKKAADEKAFQIAEKALIDAIAEAKAKIEDASKYTKESVKALKDKIKAIETTLNDGSITFTLDELRAETEAVNQLKDALKPVVIDKTALEDAIDIGTSLNIDPTTTDPEDKAVVEALQAAQDVKNNPTASQVAVNEATENLLNAMMAKEIQDESDKFLGKQAAIQLLQDALDRAELVDKTNYTDESLEALKNAVDKGKAIVQNNGEGKTIEEIAQATKDIVNAIKSLKDNVPAVDEIDTLSDALREKIKEAKAKLANPSYTADSKKALNEAVADGEGILADTANLTKEKLEEAIAKITAKIAGLKSVPVDPGPGTGGGGGGGAIFIPKDPEKPPVVKPIEKPKDQDVITITDLTLPLKDRTAYMTGYSDGTFRPDRAITRAEMTVVLTNILRISNQLTDADVSMYKDLKGNEWYSKSVGFMTKHRVVSGYPDGNFRPDAGLTRAEFAAILAKFYFVKNVDKTNVYTDVASDHWAANAIASCKAMGFMGGYPDGTFKPDQLISRAEVATTMNKLLARKADKTFIDGSKEVKVYSDDKAHWAYYDIQVASNTYDYELKGDAEKWLKILNRK